MTGSPSVSTDNCLASDQGSAHEDEESSSTTASFASDADLELHPTDAAAGGRRGCSSAAPVERPKAAAAVGVPAPPPGLPAPESPPQASGSQNALSWGSALHAIGECRPCAWFWKSSGCENAEECGFCHACLPGELKARKKAKRQSRAISRLGLVTPTKAEITMPVAPFLGTPGLSLPVGAPVAPMSPGGAQSLL